jgi:hypothetical protein
MAVCLAGTGEARSAWRLMGFLAESHLGAEPVRLRDGSVLVCGGSGNGRSCERFDVESGRWHPAPPLAAARVGHTTTALPDGSVLVTGGRTPWEADGAAPPTGSLRSAERRDPRTGQWRAVAPMHAPHDGHVAVLLPDGRVLALGGGPHATELEIWSPRYETWAPVPCPFPGFAPGEAVVLPSGTVLLAGPTMGEIGLRTRAFDPRDGRWSAGARFHRLRHAYRLLSLEGETALLLTTETTQIIGREGEALREGSIMWRMLEPKYRHFRLTEVWDPLQPRFSEIGLPVHPIWEGIPIALADGRVLAIGGEDPRASQLWSPLPIVAPPCADLEALLDGFEVPKGSRDDIHLGAWLHSWERVIPTTCRAAVLRGEAPGVMQRLEAGLPRASGMAGPAFDGVAELWRTVVCSLNPPSMSGHLAAWTRRPAFQERHVSRHRREVCLIALAESDQASRALPAVLTDSLVGPEGPAVDWAVQSAAHRSTAVRKHMAPLVRLAHEQQARDYEVLYKTVCLGPTPAELASACRECRPPRHWRVAHSDDRAELRGLGELRLDGASAPRRSAGTVGADLLWSVQHRYAAAFDFRLGATRGGGFAYEANALPLGRALHLGGGGVAGALVGVGVGGTTGEVPFAWQLPALLVLDADAGDHLRFMAWAKLSWVLGSRARDDGAPSAPFADELSGGLRVRLGQRRARGPFWDGRGAHLGLVYTESLGARSAAILAGYSLNMTGGF